MTLPGWLERQAESHCHFIQATHTKKTALFWSNIKNSSHNRPKSIFNDKGTHKIIKNEKVIFAFITSNDFFATILQDDGFVPNLVKGAHAL